MKMGNVAGIFIAASVIYILLNSVGMGVNGVRNEFYRHRGPSYTSVEQTREALTKEKERLGLTNVSIDVRFGKSPIVSAYYEGSNGEYTIILGSSRNLVGLRHELWHISKEEGAKSLWSKVTRYRYKKIFPINVYEGHKEEWDATSFGIRDR